MSTTRLDAERRAEVVSYLESHADVAARVEGYRLQRLKLRVCSIPFPRSLCRPRSISRMDDRGPAAWSGQLSPWWMAAAAAMVLYSAAVAAGGYTDCLLPANEVSLHWLEEAADNYGAYASDKVRACRTACRGQRQVGSLGRPSGCSVRSRFPIFPPPDIA